MSTTFSYDIGIGSVGAAVEKDNKLLYLGSHTFESASEAKERRANRSSRRNKARKRWRKQQLKKAFVDFKLLTQQEVDDKQFACFTVDNEKFKKPDVITVYHLRQKALKEEVSVRELFLCLHSILTARGHFLNETVDFSKEGITFELYCERFFDLASKCIELKEGSINILKEQVLSKMFIDKMSQSDINKIIKSTDFCQVDQDDDKLKQLLLILNKYKANLNIFSDLDGDNKKSSIDDLKKKEELTDFESTIVELYDLVEVSKIMKSHDYLCDIAVEKIDEYCQKEKLNAEEFDSYKKELRKDAAKESLKHVRSVRNRQNNYPNGLYVKEARAILENQRKYYSQITDEFIEVCTSIVSARIPYYIGPLGDNAKNAWADKKGNVRYSYQYSLNHDNFIDEKKSIEKWKDNMVSRCTYLPDKKALPKGSFIAETFSIINELNVLFAEDENKNEYYLTRNDKVKIFNFLCLRQKKVSYKDIAELLGLSYFGPRKRVSQNKQLNNSYSLYFDLIKIRPELKVDDILWIFDHKDRIEWIEDHILDINLFNEEVTKIKCFMEDPYNYSKDDAKKLAKLQSNSYYSLSYEIIMETEMNFDGDKMMDILFSDNQESKKNEQMTILSNAYNRNGEKINFIANKYVKRIENNKGELSIDLLLDEGKPFVPISRAVVRSLNQCLKLYQEMVNTYGPADRIVIETAGDLFGEKKATDTVLVATQKIYQQVEYETKKRNLSFNLESWQEIEPMLKNNARAIDLYIRQNGMDLLSGQKIDLHKLIFTTGFYEIDHILPRGFGMNSKNDLMITTRLLNGRKGDRLPLEFIRNNDLGDTVTEQQFVDSVKELFDMGLISPKKKDILLMDSQNDLDEFVEQNIVDTRYVIKEFMAIIDAYNQYHNYKTTTIGMSSTFTKAYRSVFNMEQKNRNLGDQHHAHDAAMLIVADKLFSIYKPQYRFGVMYKKQENKEAKENGKKDAMENFYNTVARDPRGQYTHKEDYERKRFIYNVYNKVFGQKWDEEGSFINQIKNTVPYYSRKVNKNWDGKICNATILKLDEKGYDYNSVLSIIGVNKPDRVFSDVECVAVDFYKYVDKKGNRVHAAIHIPKAIINSKGQIDKQKYIDLILKHYKIPELVKDNEVNTKFFRFRAFRNDIIYDTHNNTPFIFNLGSMVNKLLEVKHINMFSYNMLYGKEYDELRISVMNALNVKSKNNPNGFQWKDIEVCQKGKFAEDFLLDNDFKKKKYSKAIAGIFGNDKNPTRLGDYIELLRFYNLIISRPLTPPTITGQNMPSINNKSISDDDDTEYVKLKYSPLGIRFIDNKPGKLIISSPKGKQGAFKKIKRENFSWNISKYSV